jgi:alpha-mannosidase
MKKKYLTPSLFALLILIGHCQLYSQNGTSSTIEFRNAPVLFNENNKSFQQIIARYLSKTTGSIAFYSKGVELLKSDIKKGDNKFLLTFPAVTRQKTVIISVMINNQASNKYTLTLIPPKKWQINLVQHSHTDIGYTQPQSVILPKHMSYIDYALDFCDQTDNMPDDAKFRWTCESAWVVREYLRMRPAAQIERLKKRIREGRIEVTAMHCNMTEIFDENIMYDFLQPLKEFDQSGISVKTAMQNDINGVAWCLPDYFKNTGVKFLVMGINETRSILPFDIPTCFWWESPSGERMLAFRADHYHKGNLLGTERTLTDFSKNLLWYLADLDSKNYPFDRISLQYSGFYADNAPPSKVTSELVKQWNSRYEYPKLRLAVASEFFEYIETKYSDNLPVYRNAWLDWWTDGAGSTSRETAEVRKTQNLEQVDEGLFAMISIMGGGLSPALEGKLEHLSDNAMFFDEHTFGAGESIDHPFSENTTRQWMQKASFAWEALIKGGLLHEEALGQFCGLIKRADFPVIYVINSMGWKRSGNVQLFLNNEILPAQKRMNIIDIVTGKVVPAQFLQKRGEGTYWVLEVDDIPAMGYKVLKIELTDQAEPEMTLAQTNIEKMENQYYRLVIDKNTGAINSLFDKELSLELADQQNPYKIGQLVRETLPDRDTLKPSHTSVSNIKIGNGTNGQVWESIEIGADMDGFEKGRENEPKGFEMEIRLYKNVKKIEFRFRAHKEIIINPEALYVTFPFSLPDSRIVFETIGGTLTQGQQLQGSSSDWNVAQNFVSIRSGKGQIIVVSNEVPLWHFSDFNIGKWERYPKSGKPWIYSWVMNNYWYTNFRAFQEGGFSWSYQITSTKDTTNTYATKYAWSERNPFEAKSFAAGVNKLGSAVMETLKLSGSSNAMLINSRPVFNKPGKILLHFRELEGLPAEVNITSGVPGKPVSKIVEVNVIGKQIGEPVTMVHLKPFEVKFLEIEF